jgi:hypothetical protein
MQRDVGRLTGSREPSPDGLGPSGFDPGRTWHRANGKCPNLREDEVIYALGRYGDVYGPLPFELFADEAWASNMLHASHDLVAYCFFDGSWRQAFAHDAIAAEAEGDDNA